MDEQKSFNLFLGVDGGGTKTKIVIIDENERVIAENVVGGTNHNSVGAEVASKTLVSGINGAIKKARINDRPISPSDIKVACLSMSGCDKQSDYDTIRSWIQSTLPKTRINVYNDAVAALASGTQGNLYGIALISGTGMIAMGFKDGDCQRSGGFGSFVDVGSGYYIGCEVVKAAIRFGDGTGPKTSLLDALFQHLKIQSLDELLGWMYNSKMDEQSGPWARYASLAPLAFQEEKKGDEQAKAIVENAANGLAICVKTAAVKLNFKTNEAVPIVLVGGILQNPSIAKSLQTKVKQYLHNARFIFPLFEPAVGAALVAKKFNSSKL